MRSFSLFSNFLVLHASLPPAEECLLGLYLGVQGTQIVAVAVVELDLLRCEGGVSWVEPPHSSLQHSRDLLELVADQLSLPVLQPIESSIPPTEQSHPRHVEETVLRPRPLVDLEVLAEAWVASDLLQEVPGATSEGRMPGHFMQSVALDYLFEEGFPGFFHCN